MSRTVPASFSTDCIDPIILVEIEWTSGTIVYGSVTDTGIEGRILQIGDIESFIRVEGNLNSKSVSLTLDDFDDALKTLYNTDTMEGVAATVKVLVGVDELVLMKGVISSQISWSEGDRHLTLTINTEHKTDNVLVVVDEDVHPNPDSTVVPRIYGKPLKMPCKKLTRAPESAVVDNFNLFTDATFDVEDGTDFPGGTLNLRIDRSIYIQGTVSGDTVTITDANPSIYTSVPILDRSGDTDLYTLFVDAGTYTLTGNWININGNLSYCYLAVGNQHYFLSPLARLYDSSDTIDTVTRMPDSAIQTFSHRVEKGAAVIQADATEQYLLNDAAVSTLDGLWGYMGTEDGPEKILTPIPTSYWSLEDETISGVTCKVIEFSLPLASIPCEEWDDATIYASPVTAVTTNAATVIKDVLDTYTGLSTDSSSFTAAATSVMAHPVSFAIQEQIDGIRLASDIAAQCGLGLFIRNGVVFAKYLQVIDSATKTFDEADVEHKSIELSMIPSESLFTIIETSWRASGELEEPSIVRAEDNVATFGSLTSEESAYIYNIKACAERSRDFSLARKSNAWRTIRFRAFLEALSVEVFDTVDFTIPTIGDDNLRATVQNVVYSPSDFSVVIEATLASKAGTVTEDTDYWISVAGTETLPADTGTSDNPVICATPPGNVVGGDGGGCEGIVWNEPSVWPKLFPGNGFDPFRVALNVEGSYNSISWSVSLVQRQVMYDSTVKLVFANDLTAGEQTIWEPFITDSDEWEKAWFYLSPDSIVGSEYKITCTFTDGSGGFCQRSFIAEVNKRRIRAFSRHMYGLNQNKAFFAGGTVQGSNGVKLKVPNKLISTPMAPGKYVFWVEADDPIAPLTSQIAVAKYTGNYEDNLANKPAVKFLGKFTVL